jgi:hypothetical protein
VGGLRAGDEIPLLLISIYLFRYKESPLWGLFLV